MSNDPANARLAIYKKYKTIKYSTYVLVLIVAAPFIFIGFRNIAGNLYLLATGIKTEAEIYDIGEKSSTYIDKRGSVRPNLAYFPEVKFTNERGEEIRARSSSGLTINSFNIGDKVNIVYDKNNSQKFIFASLAYIDWVGPLLFGGLGIAFILVAIFITSFIEKALKKDLEISTAQ